MDRESKGDGGEEGCGTRMVPLLIRGQRCSCNTTIVPTPLPHVMTVISHTITSPQNPLLHLTLKYTHTQTNIQTHSLSQRRGTMEKQEEKNDGRGSGKEKVIKVRMTKRMQGQKRGDKKDADESHQRRQRRARQ